MSQNGWEDLPSSGGGSSSNASVGSNGVTAPTSSTEIGFINGSGNLTAVSPSNPLPVDIHVDTVVVSENLTQIAGNAINTGTGAAGSGTMRVAVSSDSSLTSVGSITNPVASTQSGTWNVTNVSGTVSLPTGASTSANQTTANSSLSTIATNTTLPGAVYSGQKTSTGTAVAIATSQALTQGVIISALAANAGKVYVGPSGVTTSTGYQLQPGQAVSMAINNLSLAFVIAATSGDGICFVGS